MYTPSIVVSSVLSAPSAIAQSGLFDKPPRFSFDIAGVASLLGGDDAVSAMVTAHVYGKRHYLGWYNTPGSFQVAKRLRAFTKRASLYGIFSANSSPKSKSVQLDPTTLFELDTSKGPKFRAAHSGTVMEETGYLAALFMKECGTWNLEERVLPGRTTQPIRVTIAELGQAPPSETYPAYKSAITLCLASIPITASVGTCVLSALCEDWYASLLILVGIVASGISSIVIGSADFVFTHPEPAKGSPAGDGILGSDKEFVLLKGAESAVNCITRGTFSFRFSSEAHYALVRWCSFLFLAQSLVQLLLIPQATLFGQIMFLGSLGISAMYNALLSSTDIETIHRKLMFKQVLGRPPLTKYTLGTRTTAVVFVLLVLRPSHPMRLLDDLLPNDTKVWRAWKATMLKNIQHPDDAAFSFERGLGDQELDRDGFSPQERDLLALLYGDARAAYEGYKEYLRVDVM